MLGESQIIYNYELIPTISSIIQDEYKKKYKKTIDVKMLNIIEDRINKTLMFWGNDGYNPFTN